MVQEIDPKYSGELINKESIMGSSADISKFRSAV